MRRQLFICLLLVGITAGLYWPAGSYEAVDFDDAFFTDNPEVQSGWNGHSLAWTMTAEVVANWHPVTLLSFILTHQFFGRNAGAEHLVNVLIHAANAGLLFLVLGRMTRRRADAAARPADVTWGCAAAAALFAWHPLRVESVAWIAERKDGLCAFFMLLTLWAWTRYAQETETETEMEKRKAESGKRKFFYGLALGVFALALMSKAMAVTLPFLLLLLDMWPLKRFTIYDLRFTILKRLVVEKIPFLALTAGFCVITFLVQRGSGATPSLQELGLGIRLENIIVSYLRYLGWTVWPAKLAVYYPFPYDDRFYLALWPGWQIGAGALLLVAITGLCLKQIARRPYLAVGWFWYLGTLVPVIGWVQVGGQGMADRYTYIPLIGPVIAVVWLVMEMSEARKISKVMVAGLAVVILGACLAQTRGQLQFWKNSDDLFQHAISVTGINPRAEYLLGLSLEREGRMAEAMAHYRNAINSPPKVKEAFANLGRLLGQQGKWSEAEALYTARLEEYPNDFDAHLGLAITLPHLRRNPEAETQLQAAIKTCPNAPEALNNLAWLLATSEEAKLRDGPRAVELAQRACDLTSYRETIMVGTLGAAYAEAGRFDEAILTAQKACALAGQSGAGDLLKVNQQLLELYRQHQPDHESN